MDHPQGASSRLENENENRSLRSLRTRTSHLAGRRPTLVLVLVLVLVLGPTPLAPVACASPPARPPASPAGVVAAFRDCLYTHYAERAGARLGPDLLRLRSEAQARLLVELEARGVEVARGLEQKGLAAIAPLVERYLHGRTVDVAFAEVEAGKDDAPGSFLVVGGVTRQVGEVALAGREARYGLIVWRAELIRPYDDWRAGAPPGGVRAVGRTIYVDAAAPDVPFKLRVAAAGLLFAGTKDRGRRDAQTLVALLDGDDETARRALALIAALAGTPAGRLALDAVREAGVLPAEDVSPADRHKIVKSALRPGGLLDTAHGDR